MKIASTEACNPCYSTLNCIIQFVLKVGRNLTKVIEYLEDLGSHKADIDKLLTLPYCLYLLTLQGLAQAEKAMVMEGLCDIINSKIFRLFLVQRTDSVTTLVYYTKF